MNLFLSIALLAVFLSVVIQYTSFFKEDVLFRRFVASIVLAWPAATAFMLSGNLKQLGLTFTNPKATILFSLFFSLLSVLVNFFAAGKEENVAMYPQLRISYWSPAVFLLNTLTWSVYLIAYEILFRGYLFLACLELYGLTTATIINVGLYALAHLPKSIKESLLTIPFGALLCILTGYTGNVWSAVIIHLVLALSNDYYALRANPDMTLFTKPKTL